MDLSIEDALDDCMRRLEHEGLEACLRRYPQYRAELEPLLRLSADMQRTVTRAEPRPVARAAIRQRVLAATQDTPAVPPAPSRNGAAPTEPVVSLNGRRLVAVAPAARRPLQIVARPWQVAAAVILLVLAG
ncbi:MAG TPA: hypothetical protein VFM49_15850, partial [Chloroflexia bacterium]|nr:hypothetical protein [Chloroflexia bacterium]